MRERVEGEGERDRERERERERERKRGGGGRLSACVWESAIFKQEEVNPGRYVRTCTITIQNLKVHV